MTKVPYKPGPKSSKKSKTFLERGSLGESTSNTDDSTSNETDVNSQVPRTPERRRKTKHLVGIENLSEFQTPDTEDDITDYGLEFTTSHIQSSPRRCSTFKKTGQSSQEENQENNPNPGTSKQPHKTNETTTSAKRTPAATQKEAAQKRRKQRNPVQLEKRFWKEVQTLQNRTDFLIPLLPFSRLVRELIQCASTEVTKITPAAMEALQASSELYLTQRLQDAYMLTLHRGRVTLDGTSVLSPSIPLTLVVLPAFIIAQKSPENIFTEHPSLYIVAFGMVAAKVTNKLVIAHMTKAEMEYLDWSLLGPALLFLNQYFNCVLPEIWLLWFTLIWGTQDLIRYCSQVCLEICAHLHIQLFTIPYPGKGGVSKSHASKAGQSNNHGSKPKGVQTVNQGTNPPLKHKNKKSSIVNNDLGLESREDLDAL